MVILGWNHSSYLLNMFSNSGWHMVLPRFVIRVVVTDSIGYWIKKQRVRKIPLPRRAFLLIPVLAREPSNPSPLPSRQWNGYVRINAEVQMVLSYSEPLPQ